MENSQHRHDVSDEVWTELSPHLPGQWGRVAEDNRKFINAVFWILRTGAPWRDMPPSYGKWNSVAKRYRRWCESGTWSRVLEKLLSALSFMERDLRLYARR